MSYPSHVHMMDPVGPFPPSPSAKGPGNFCEGTRQSPPGAAASTLVMRSEPGAGAVLRLGVRVTLILSEASPTPTGQATPPASGGDGS